MEKVMLTDDEKLMRERLIRAAQSRKGYIYFSDLIKECRLKLDMDLACDRAKLGEMLGNISEFEVQNNRPMLSSVALAKNNHDNDSHGVGFYSKAEELYNTDLSSDNKASFASEQMNLTTKLWRINALIKK